MELAARVRHEEVVEPVARPVAHRDAHPRVRIVHPRDAASLDQPEAERVAGLCDVEVEPVRVEVVRDVEVEASVEIDVGEHRAEPVVERRRLEAGARADLAERAVPPVQVEEVAHARWFAGNPAVELGSRPFGSV